MPCIPHLGQLLRKRLNRVRGHKPRRLDTVLVPQLQETVDADGDAEHATRDVSWVGGGAVAGVDPVSFSARMHPVCD